jgi:hypothetical protein
MAHGQKEKEKKKKEKGKLPLESCTRTIGPACARDKRVISSQTIIVHSHLTIVMHRPKG